MLSLTEMAKNVLAPRPDSSKTLQARLDRLRNEELPAANEAYRTARRAVREGASTNTLDAARAHVESIEREIRDLEQCDIPDALEREAAEAEAAATAEEKRRAEARTAEEKSRYRGLTIDLANWCKAGAPIPEACAALALAVKAMNASAANVYLKMPQGDDVPLNSTLYRFDETMFSALVAEELARAGAAHGVDLPGAAAVIPDEPLAERQKAISDVINGHGKRVIVEHWRVEPGPVISGSYAAPSQPKGPRKLQRSHEDQLAEARTPRFNPRSGKYDLPPLSLEQIQERDRSTWVSGDGRHLEVKQPSPRDPRHAFEQASAGSGQALEQPSEVPARVPPMNHNATIAGHLIDPEPLPHLTAAENDLRRRMVGRIKGSDAEMYRADAAEVWAEYEAKLVAEMRAPAPVEGPTDTVPDAPLPEAVPTIVTEIEETW